MGTIKKGILGGFSGKVGTVVGASWKGIDYIRSLPTTVRNPRTPGQLNQRGKFSTVISFLSKITPLIKIGFKDYTSKQTAVNAAMSYNLTNAVVGDAGVYEMDFEKVMVSRGPLFKPVSGEVLVADGEISIGWNVDSEGNGSKTDMANILVYNSTKDEAIVMLNVNDRFEGYAPVTYQDHWKGDNVEIYVSFISADGRLVSDSMYLGSHPIPAI
ncbi:MAG: DUF6266 family protein [Fermentimonas sp.]|nr:DUF6266 family protein [Fermentimonas sp.]